MLKTFMRRGKSTAKRSKMTTNINEKTDKKHTHSTVMCTRVTKRLQKRLKNYKICLAPIIDDGDFAYLRRGPLSENPPIH